MTNDNDKPLDHGSITRSTDSKKLNPTLASDPFPGTYDLEGNRLINSGEAVDPTDVPNFIQVQGLIQDLSEDTGASLIGYKQSKTGATTRTVQDKLDDIVSVFDFMTAAQVADVRAGGLSLDVAPPIQAALDACPSKTVYFPAGAYLLNSGLNVRVSTRLVGAGPKETFLYFALTSGSSNNLISINASSGGVIWYGGGINEISIVDLTASSNTTGVYVENVVDGIYQNVNLTGMHVGWSFSNGLNRIWNTQISTLGGVASTAIGVLADGASCGVSIFDSLIQSNTAPANQIGVGYLFRNGASPTMRAANTYGCSKGCQLTAVGATMYWPELVDCQFDTASDTGLLINTGAGGAIFGMSIVNLWCGTFAGYGVHITQGVGTINGLNFVGGRIFSNTHAGFFIESGSNISISNMIISGNGSGSNPGIAVLGPVAGLLLTGNRIGASSQFGATQNYGIQLGAFAISNCVIVANNLTGNIAAGIINSSTSPVVITGNAGG